MSEAQRRIEQLESEVDRLKTQLTLIGKHRQGGGSIFTFTLPETCRPLRTKTPDPI